MKNLKGMKDFSSFENKKLQDLKTIVGGNGPTKDSWNEPTCRDNTPDVDGYVDGVKQDGPVKDPNFLTDNN